MISWYVICTQLYFNQFLSYNLCLNYLISNTENKEMINKRYKTKSNKIKEKPLLKLVN